MAEDRYAYYVIGVAALILFILVDAYIVLPIQPKLVQSSAPTTNLVPTREIIIYGGPTPQGFGFGLSPDNITTPGPTLRFKAGEVVKITFKNVGNIPHAFGIVSQVGDNPNILFNSAIGRLSPLQPGEESSVVVQFNQVGEFYYQCLVPGHADSGMWGEVVVES